MLPLKRITMHSGLPFDENGERLVSFTVTSRADSGHVAAYPACVKNLAQASADNRRTNCPMRRRSASQKPNRQPRLRISAPIGNPDSIPTETALMCDSRHE
jgi:hypothetical protein